MSVGADFLLARQDATMETSLNIDVVERDGSLFLIVEGELDIATVASLGERLAQAEASDAARIIVDLDGVGFMDSSALHLLFTYAQRSSRDGQRLRLTRGSPQARRLFEMTGMLDRLPFIEA